MDQLPAELLIHITDFLSTKQLHVVMRVNRRWQAAAVTAVTQKKALAIGTEYPGAWNRCSELDVVKNVNEELQPLMWQSLQKVSSITWLCT